MPHRSTADKAARRRASAARRQTHLGVPSDKLAQSKEALPYFEPIDLHSLLLAARRKTGAQSIDEKIESVLSHRLRAQTEQLLRALGFNPDENKWQSAFMRLAKHHHGLGLLVYIPRRTNSNARRWRSPKHDRRLLEVLQRLKAEGIEGSAAFKTIASRPKLRNQFPYKTRSQIKGRDKLAKSLSERFRKLSQRNGLLKALTGGLSPDAGEIEALLWWLDTESSIKAAKNEND
jgi:phage-related protein